MNDSSEGLATQQVTKHIRTGARCVPPSLRRFVATCLREPLLHFLLLGLSLFALHGLLNDGPDEGPPSREIALTAVDLRQLLSLFEAQWQRPPTPAELDLMVENRVQEEVLYREAIALGLDEDDTIVKRRMAQKMQFIADTMASAREPSTAELRAWFESHRENFARPARLSFRLLYFSPDLRGARARADADAALRRLAAEPENAKLAAALSDPFPLQDYYTERTPEQLSREFGTQFAQAITALRAGSWQGPIASGFGWHLVRIEAVVAGGLPAFDEVEAEVRLDWTNDQKAQAWRQAYKAMRANYTVRLPMRDADTPAPTAQVSAISGKAAQ